MRPRPVKRSVAKVNVEAFASFNSKPDPINQNKKIKVKDLGGRLKDDNDTGVIDANTPDEYMEARIAFCCYQCFCSDEDKKRIPAEDPFIQSSMEGLYHRRCCHEAIEPDEHWISPFEEATEKVLLQKEEEVCHNIMTLHELSERYDVAIRHQNALYNADGLPEFASVLQTSEDYIENQKRFFQIPKRTSDDDAIVVLDMFAGIGSGIVALKRLGIPIKTIIHVEHDPVANHVYKWNHDPAYNDSLSKDGIEHIYFDKFEQFEDDDYLQEILSIHGPIDLVMGGPPCIDYSGLNAHGEGINGAQGSYMPRFGTLIQKIQRIQTNHHVFFLAENTILRNDKQELNLEEGDLECIKESFGVQWVMDVDASYFTPGRRNRTYISNIPLLTKTDDYILDEELVDSPYLTDDFVHCAHYMCDHMKVPRIPEKVACLLASKSRIDKHPTMSVVKTSKGDDGMEYIEHRPLNIKEREAVMGFPVGYVEDAVKNLFESLLQNGYGNTRLATYEPYWKNSLPLKYHLFGGLPVRFYSSGYDLGVQLQPPKVNTVDVYYTEEQYGKRLIGNAFSVPVVEILLRQLQTKFSEREYSDYTYSFKWQTSRVRVKHEH